MYELGDHPTGKYTLLADEKANEKGYIKCWWKHKETDKIEEIELNIIDPSKFLGGIYKTFGM